MLSLRHDSIGLMSIQIFKSSCHWHKCNQFIYS